MAERQEKIEQLRRRLNDLITEFENDGQLEDLREFLRARKAKMAQEKFRSLDQDSSDQDSSDQEMGVLNATRTSKSSKRGNQKESRENNQKKSRENDQEKSGKDNQEKSQKNNQKDERRDSSDSEDGRRGKPCRHCSKREFSSYSNSEQDNLKSDTDSDSEHSSDDSESDSDSEHSSDDSESDSEKERSSSDSDHDS
jgi:hypothetical protein